MGISSNEENPISSSSSDPLQWQKIFNALVQMIKSQQAQLQTLAEDRILLEDRIQIQHQRWLSDVRLLENQIFQVPQKKKSAHLQLQGLFLGFCNLGFFFYLFLSFSCKVAVKEAGFCHLGLTFFS